LEPTIPLIQEQSRLTIAPGYVLGNFITRACGGGSVPGGFGSERVARWAARGSPRVDLISRLTRCELIEQQAERRKRAREIVHDGMRLCRSTASIEITRSDKRESKRSKPLMEFSFQLSIGRTRVCFALKSRGPAFPLRAARNARGV
jgi:hypothetical protein